ncbi:hypothetical protein [Streptomyces sp. NPDC001502]|uniref:hypothetical protein n=1 Tax=Streptomyces sp. NPDC001502 TaxID=3364578 RepID=UPI0036C402A4
MTRTRAGTRDHLATWLAEATRQPDTSLERWSRHPLLLRRLRTGVTFDAVLADRTLVVTAISILRSYGQPVGPAIAYPFLGSAAVLVPCGTASRWSEVTAHWPERAPRPLCLGQGHTLQVPAPLPQRGCLPAQWLEPPDPGQMIGDGPLLTSPPALARCLAEARAVLTAEGEPRPLRRVAGTVRAALSTPKGTG